MGGAGTAGLVWMSHEVHRVLRDSVNKHAKDGAIDNPW